MTDRNMVHNIMTKSQYRNIVGSNIVKFDNMVNNIMTVWFTALSI